MAFLIRYFAAQCSKDSHSKQRKNEKTRCPQKTLLVRNIQLSRCLISVNKTSKQPSKILISLVILEELWHFEAPKKLHNFDHISVNKFHHLEFLSFVIWDSVSILKTKSLAWSWSKLCNFFGPSLKMRFFWSCFNVLLADMKHFESSIFLTGEVMFGAPSFFVFALFTVCIFWTLGCKVANQKKTWLTDQLLEYQTLRKVLVSFRLLRATFW